MPKGFLIENYFKYEWMALVTTNEVKLQKEPSVKIKKRRTINSSFSKKNHLNVIKNLEFF